MIAGTPLYDELAASLACGWPTAVDNPDDQLSAGTPRPPGSEADEVWPPYPLGVGGDHG